jgi:hypothetical protein
MREPMKASITANQERVDRELVDDRSKTATSEMERKDEMWGSECRLAFVRALQARLAERDSDLEAPDTVNGGESA